MKKMRLFFFLAVMMFAGILLWENSSGQKLFDAYKNGDLTKFCALVQNKPKLAYQKTSKGYDILSLLCVDDDPADKYINCLLNACPSYDLNKFTSKEYPPIFYALNGNINNLQTLLDRNINLDIFYHDSYPLIDALMFGHTEAAMLLINKGANVNVVDFQNTSALAYASFYGFSKVVEELLRKNAKTEIKDKEGNTALLYASGCPNADLEDKEDKLFSSPKKEVVSLLVEHGAEINVEDLHNWTPLMYACNVNNYEIIEYLLSKEVKINHQDLDGKTALMISCIKGDLKSIKILIANKANVSLKDNSGKSALTYAQLNNCSEVVEFIKSFLHQN